MTWTDATVLQRPGDIIYVPEGWWHATCTIEGWNVAVGMQRGNPGVLNQMFEPLIQPYVVVVEDEEDNNNNRQWHQHQHQQLKSHSSNNNTSAT